MKQAAALRICINTLIYLTACSQSTVSNAQKHQHTSLIFPRRLYPGTQQAMLSLKAACQCHTASAHHNDYAKAAIQPAYSHKNAALPFTTAGFYQTKTSCCTVLKVILPISSHFLKLTVCQSLQSNPKKNRRFLQDIPTLQGSYVCPACCAERSCSVNQPPAAIHKAPPVQGVESISPYRQLSGNSKSDEIPITFSLRQHQWLLRFHGRVWHSQQHQPHLVVRSPMIIHMC